MQQIQGFAEIGFLQGAGFEGEGEGVGVGGDGDGGDFQQLLLEVFAAEGALGGETVETVLLCGGERNTGLKLRC